VHVTRVQAVGCGNGVIESFDESNTEADGSFVDSTITDVTVSGGHQAQLGRPGTDGMWTVGTSQRAFSKDVPTRTRWSVVYDGGTYACRGPFRSAPDRIRTSSGFALPVCG